MENERLAGSRDTSLLKIIAALCMFIDHAGVRLCNNMTEMRVVGRLAFPLYVWCMVVGSCYTKQPYRYALRLLLVGIISQPFYMLGLQHSWDKISVFGTLFLGYAGILGMREKRYGSQYWAPILAVAAACVFSVDYGWRGVLLILLLYLVRESRSSILAVFIAYCLFWGLTSARITAFLGIPLQSPKPFADFSAVIFRLQAMALLALPLILWPRQERCCRIPKALGYAVYPVHLLVLWIVRLLMGLVTMQDSLRLIFPWM